MDYETLHILFRSRQTLLKLLADRGYNTKPFEKFGPIEVAAMAAAGANSFRMDLQRTDSSSPITKCRVVYSINRVKNRLPSFIDEQIDAESDDAVDPATTELIIILLE